MTPRAPTGNSLIVGAAMSPYPSRLASQIEAGAVWINKHLNILPYVPFGGAKSSGIGRELGEEGLAEFTQLQFINIAV
jgi:acyl-CoA reductase-like NAD-dependent aldehyde dehydrogenase